MGDHAADGGEDLTIDETAGRSLAEGAERADDAAVALEQGRLLFAQECRFVAGAATLPQIPGDSLPELAFAGRSNVGKSSLVNALTGRRTLARVSNTPGRTRQLNFFDLGGRLMLTDLPGYGYAQTSKQQVAEWSKVIDRYLVGRASLRRALLLIDSRHGPKDVDRRVMTMLDRAAVSYQVVLTKTDKLPAPALAERIGEVAAELARHTAGHPEVMPTSASDGAGIPELRAALVALALPPRTN